MSLNANLQTIVRATKTLKLEYSITDIALMAGLRRETVHRNVTKMDKYRKKCDIANSLDIAFLEEQSLKIMIDRASSIKEVLGAIAGHKLRYQTHILSRLNTSQQVLATGTAFIEICRLIMQNKGYGVNGRNEGTIYHRNKSVRTLQDQVKDITDLLFTRRYLTTSTRIKAAETKYQPLVWTPTPTSIITLKDTINDFVDVHLRGWVGRVQRSHITGALCIGNQSSVTFTNSHNYQFTNTSPKVFEVSHKSFISFSFQSQLHLLDSYKFTTSKGVLVFGANHSSPTNQNFGRCYNVVTRILSDERKLAGYRNYDISAALQVIALHFVDEPKRRYPMLYRYSRVIKYKQYIRRTIATDKDWSIARVKQTLTAYSNGKICNDKNPLLKQFAEESDRLRREFMRSIDISEPEVIDRAAKQSRRNIDRSNTNWVDVAMDSMQESQDKSSIFFFTWTWYERKIRMAMLDLLSDGIEVHDAVYTKQEISTVKLRKHIRAKTGLQMMITKD